jgi:hypothetical protein
MALRFAVTFDGMYNPMIAGDVPRPEAAQIPLALSGSGLPVPQCGVHRISSIRLFMNLCVVTAAVEVVLPAEMGAKASRLDRYLTALPPGYCAPRVCANPPLVDSTSSSVQSGGANLGSVAGALTRASHANRVPARPKSFRDWASGRRSRRCAGCTSCLAAGALDHRVRLGFLTDRMGRGTTGPTGLTQVPRAACPVSFFGNG